MIIKKATQIGNPIIRRKSKPVSDINSTTTHRIIKNLIDSMRYHGLVGMAAPQIGINKRIFVTKIRKTPSRNPEEIDPVRIFINPKIVRKSKNQVPGFEGCGSVASAGIFGNVRRSYGVTVSALNEKSERFTLKAAGLLARIIQHENDHLDGKVFLDRMTDMKSLMSREEYLRK